MWGNWSQVQGLAGYETALHIFSVVVFDLCVVFPRTITILTVEKSNNKPVQLLYNSC